MNNLTRFLVIFSAIVIFCEGKGWTDEEETPEYWYDVAREELQVALGLQQKNMNVAKNVILFLGDGMSIGTITAGRILKGQLQGNSGEETKLAMDQFHHAGLSRTYAVNKQVADSGSTATAYLCGVKSTYYTLGLSAKSRTEVCSSEKGNAVESILVDSYKAGKSTGVVTTTRINHATPGASYAHTAYRSWYSDSDLTQEAKENGCKDIAQQFYDSSDMITVTLGGGRQYFRPKTTKDVEYSTDNDRDDGQELIEKWEMNQKDKGLNAHYVWNKNDFDSVDPVTTDKLLGLFEPSDMQYEVDRVADGSKEPSIMEMTEKAIQILQKNSKGYFLLVEGGRIDHAHHATNAHRALHETVAFDKAIERAVEMTSDSDTLIIVTADHSHTFTIGGYSDRGNDIFGLATENGKPYKGLDGKPFTTINYANGEGYQGPNTGEIEPHSRQNLTVVDTDDKEYLQQTAIPLAYETHGGDDVAILARGPMSHLFHGVHQQNYIAYVMRYVSCVGSDLGHCEGSSLPEPEPTTTTEKYNLFLGMNLDTTETAVALYVQFALLICFAFFTILLSTMLYKKGMKRFDGSVEKKYDNIQSLRL
ncbi:alkaline phosphatase-like [Clavelina lepadiformis]|uniref:Alkaline phosphatase n=1 Tax=Clavelina lepadiformis TaxID=159417 RepID=A0ABP0H4I0_CLALP